MGQLAYQAQSGIHTGLHIDVHGPLGVQQPLSHPDQGPQHIWGGLGNHQDLAWWIQPVQLQMRTWETGKTVVMRGVLSVQRTWDTAGTVVMNGVQPV